MVSFRTEISIWCRYDGRSTATLFAFLVSFVCFLQNRLWIGFTLTSSTAHDERSDDVARRYKLSKLSVEQNLQHDFLVFVFRNVCATTVRGLQYCLAGLPHNSYTASSFFLPLDVGRSIGPVTFSRGTASHRSVHTVLLSVLTFPGSHSSLSVPLIK
jgi:hypothetical protein